MYCVQEQAVTPLPDASAQDKRATLEALYVALETGLRLLHPFMPFVTEELWQHLPRAAACAKVESIMLAPYPVQTAEWEYALGESQMEQAMCCVRAARRLRAAYGLQPRSRPDMFILARTDTSRDSALATQVDVRALAGAGELTILDAATAAPRGCAAAVVSDSLSLFVALKGLDVKAETEKMQKKIDALTRSCESLSKQAAGIDYVTKVPATVRAENADKVQRLSAEIEEGMKVVAIYRELM